MRKNKKLEYDRFLKEYSYISSDLEYKNTLIEENQSEFLNLVNELEGKEKDVEKESKIANEEKEKKKKPSWNSFDEDVRSKAKKLYREISKKAHPDKDPSGIYSDLFTEVVDAYEGCYLFDLFLFCDILNIEYEMTEKEMNMLRFEIEEKKKTIEKIEKSFIYSWITNEDPRIKSILVKRFSIMTKKN
jgi:hypothetical protein